MVRTFFALLLSTCALFAQFYQGHVPTTRKPVDTYTYKSEDEATTFFVVGYSNKTRTPTWTAFEIDDPRKPNLSCDRAGKFASEGRADPVVVHTDYAAIPDATAYSRGHMVPNSVMAYWRGCEGNKASFITSNIVPQLQGNNAGVWEALESAIAGKKKPGGSFNTGLIGRSKHVWVFAGPVYWGRTADIEKMGPKEIWVPTSLWKTVIWVDDKGEERTCSWIIPHRADIPRNAYMEYTVSIQEVYRKTGVNVLPSKIHRLYTQMDAEEFISMSDD